jgi:hypothetical protein
MKNYYCIDLKFKKKSISELVYHAHLYIKAKKIFIRIIEKKEESGVCNRYMLRNSNLGFFDDDFEIVNSEFEIITKNSRVSGARSSENKLYHSYFTIYLSSIGTIKPNVYKENINTGKAILNSNGLRVVNQFYSYFTNFRDKNKYEISRMNGMARYFNLKNFKYRPELDFISNETRESASFKVEKIPTINFIFENIAQESIKENIEVICKFISFCYGIRVNYSRLIYRTEDHIYFYFNNEKLDSVYKSSFLTVFEELNTFHFIEKILRTNWHSEFIIKKNKIDKAIDNLLHSREVESSSRYLLLFNIIEIFNVNVEEQKFEIDSTKSINLKTAVELLEDMLTNRIDVDNFRDKCEGIIGRVFIKPLKSPLEETLKNNNINCEDFGFKFTQLKKMRDKIAHGSVNSIKDDTLKKYIYVIQRICTRLILSQLGLKKDLRNGI